MAIYFYKAKKGPSEIVEGKIEAASQDEAVDKLSAMGLIPSSVIAELDVRREDSTVKDISRDSAMRCPCKERSPMQRPLSALTAIGIRPQDINIFTRQLSSLIKSGVPVLRALSLLFRQTENKSLAAVIADVERRIRDGKMFSEALAEYPRLFNNLFVNMVRSGEKSGALNEVLNNMADYRQKEEDMRQKIQAALAYPILIMVVGFTTVFIMLTFFLPKLTSLFENMRQSLPLSTRILINISHFMAGNWYLFLIAAVFLFAIFGRVRAGSKKKLFFDFIKLRLPVVKKFVRDAEVAKFARALALLIKNGISVCEGLELATAVLDNDLLKERLGAARKDIIDQGCALSSSFNKIEIFPSFVINMIAVGEEGGKLEDSLKIIAELYESQAEQAVKIMSSLLEPLLILGIGAIVGFIVFAMLLPVFNVGLAVH